MVPVSVKSLAAAATLTLTCGFAQAVTIGFDSLTFNSPTFVGVAGDTYREAGFTFSSTELDGYGLYTWWSGSPLNADPGGATLIENDDGGTLTVTRTGGGSFSLASFDLADGYNLGTGGPIAMSYTDASGTHSQWLQLPAQPGLHTFDFGYKGLTSFALVQNAPFFQLDNVNVSAVPEPSSAALGLAGLAALGLASLRRRRA